MLPAGKPAKSAASQPLVEVLPIPSCRSTAVTAAVTSPGSDCVISPKSTPSTYVTAFGAICCRAEGPTTSNAR